MNMKNPLDRLPVALLTLRLGVFVVMLMWTLDKFIRPEHSARVFANFYGLSGLEQPLFYAIGAAESLLILGFLLGVAKRLTYAAVLVLHAISTFSSYKQYLHPFDNLLFFAAWPMLAACFALYYLRDYDTLGVVGQRQGPEPVLRHQG